MNTNVTIKGTGVKAAPNIGGAATVEQHKPQAHGELLPIEPAATQRPTLPIVLRGSLTHNLEYEESVECYGLWTVTTTQQVWVRGRLLKPGDSAQLDGATLQYLLGIGKAKVVDPRLAAESKILDAAQALGLPQKIRELASFAPKRSKWKVQPESANE